MGRREHGSELRALGARFQLTASMAQACKALSQEWEQPVSAVYRQLIWEALTDRGIDTTL